MRDGLREFLKDVEVEEDPIPDITATANHLVVVANHFKFVESRRNAFCVSETIVGIPKISVGQNYNMNETTRRRYVYVQ